MSSGLFSRSAVAAAAPPPVDGQPYSTAATASAASAAAPASSATAAAIPLLHACIHATRPWYAAACRRCSRCAAAAYGTPAAVSTAASTTRAATPVKNDAAAKTRWEYTVALTTVTVRVDVSVAAEAETTTATADSAVARAAPVVRPSAILLPLGAYQSTPVCGDVISWLPNWLASFLPL